jgi:hypothetical protein
LDCSENADVRAFALGYSCGSIFRGSGCWRTPLHLAVHP